MRENATMKLTLKHPDAHNGIPVFTDGGERISDAAVIKHLRSECNMTAAKFGLLLGVSERTVNGWEQGRPVNALSILFIQKLFTTPPSETIRRPKFLP